MGGGARTGTGIVQISIITHKCKTQPKQLTIRKEKTKTDATKNGPAVQVGAFFCSFFFPIAPTPPQTHPKLTSGPLHALDSMPQSSQAGASLDWESIERDALSLVASSACPAASCCTRAARTKMFHEEEGEGDQLLHSQRLQGLARAVEALTAQVARLEAIPGRPSPPSLPPAPGTTDDTLVAPALAPAAPETACHAAQDGTRALTCLMHYAVQRHVTMDRFRAMIDANLLFDGSVSWRKEEALGARVANLEARVHDLESAREAQGGGRSDESHQQRELERRLQQVRVSTTREMDLVCLFHQTHPHNTTRLPGVRGPHHHAGRRP